MSGGVPILTYHSIDESGSVLSVSPGTFRRHMDILLDSGTAVLRLDEAVSRLKAGSELSNSVVITFDDAFENVRRHAAPLLIDRSWPATVFAVSGFAGRTNDWPGQPDWARRSRLMDAAQLAELGRHGIDIGSHSVHHPDLTAIPSVELLREVSESRRQLEDATGRAVTSFAYPLGRANRAARDSVASVYSLAVSTSLRFARPGDDPFFLPRIDMFYLRPPAIFARLLSPAARGYLGVRRALRLLRGTEGYWP